MDMYRQRLRDHDEKDTELNAKIRDVDSRIDTLKDQVAEHRPAEVGVNRPFGKKKKGGEGGLLFVCLLVLMVDCFLLLVVVGAVVVMLMLILLLLRWLRWLLWFVAPTSIHPSIP